MTGTRVTTNDPSYASWSGGGRVLASREFGRFTGFGALSYNRLTGDAPFQLFGLRRRDRSFELLAGVAFRQIQLSGFSPLVRASFTSNDSNLPIYDFTRKRIELGLSRQF